MELAEYHSRFFREEWRGNGKFAGYCLKKTACSNTIEKGDVVFLHSIPSAFTKGLVKEYVESIGAVLTKDINVSTKIVSTNSQIVYRYWETLPVAIDPFIARLNSVVWFSLIDRKIREYLNNKREIQPFSVDGVDTIISLLKSNSVDNAKIACILIMSMDWADQEFYLFFIFSYYYNSIKNAVPSQIPNWSNWNRNQRVGLLNYTQHVSSVFEFIKRFTITEQQQSIIKKYL